MVNITEIKNKNILFVSTKNSDYLRICQEIRILEENGNALKIISSPKKSYFKRLIYVYKEILKVNMNDFDMSFIAFAPQLVIPVFKHKLLKKPIIEDFFISMYDTLCFDRKKFRPQSLIGKFIKYIDRITLQSAELAICDTKAHGSYFCEEFKYPRNKMKVLYLEADKNIYYPRQMPKNNKFTVLYFGSVLPLQGVQVILDAIEILENKENIKFIFIGPLGKNNIKKGEKITEFIEWLPQDKLAEKIAGVDLCLAGHFDGNIMKAKRTIPGKAYIYRAMNKPMILGDNQATHELYNESDKDIFFVEMGNPQKLADLILKISEDFYEKDS
ncbi:MAG: glycosyltransferase [Oscillospiraceae bacterium]|nr:glycosyltransferase [Oscillospiraceae bacterium]